MDPGGKQANDKMLPESTGQGVRADRPLRAASTASKRVRTLHSLGTPGVGVPSL